MVWRRLQSVLHHDIPCGKHRVARVVGEPRFMAQQLFHRDVEMPLVANRVGVERVVKQTFRAEDMVGKLQASLFAELHDANRRQQFADRSNPHDVARRHRLAPFLIRPSEAFCIHQRIIS